MAARKRGSESFVAAHRDEPAGEVWGIAELASELGLTPRALRFYEAKGLLAPKRVGRSRIYGRRERARLQLILRGRALGLPLKEIQRYLELYGVKGEGRRSQLEHVVSRCSKRIDELEAKRQQLDETLAELRFIRSESQKKLRALTGSQ